MERENEERWEAAEIPPLPPGRRIVVSTPAYASTAAAFLAEAIRRSEGSETTVALTGGRTPRPVYERLAEIPALPWDRVRIFFGDERCVPPEHEESNHRMASQALLERIDLAADRIHRMEGEREDREDAAARYAKLLPDSLDLLLLGVGADAHIASLFPGSPQLSETSRRVVPSRAPEPPRDRLTVTPPVVRAARLRVVLVAGEEKATAVRQALEGEWNPLATPAQLARDGVWILDVGAAAALAAR